MMMNQFKQLLETAIFIISYHYNYLTNGENIFRQQNDQETYVLVNMFLNRAMIFF